MRTHQCGEHSKCRVLTKQSKVGLVIEGLPEMTFEPDPEKVRHVDEFGRAEVILIWG